MVDTAVFSGQTSTVENFSCRISTDITPAKVIDALELIVKALSFENRDNNLRFTSDYLALPMGFRSEYEGYYRLDPHPASSPNWASEKILYLPQIRQFLLSIVTDGADESQRSIYTRFHEQINAIAKPEEKQSVESYFHSQGLRWQVLDRQLLLVNTKELLTIVNIIAHAGPKPVETPTKRTVLSTLPATLAAIEKNQEPALKSWKTIDDVLLTFSNNTDNPIEQPYYLYKKEDVAIDVPVIRTFINKWVTTLYNQNRAKVRWEQIVLDLPQPEFVRIVEDHLITELDKTDLAEQFARLRRDITAAIPVAKKPASYASGGETATESGETQLTQKDPEKPDKLTSVLEKFAQAKTSYAAEAARLEALLLPQFFTLNGIAGSAAELEAFDRVDFLFVQQVFRSDLENILRSLSAEDFQLLKDGDTFGFRLNAVQKLYARLYADPRFIASLQNYKEKFFVGLSEKDQQAFQKVVNISDKAFQQKVADAVSAGADWSGSLTAKAGTTPSVADLTDLKGGTQGDFINLFQSLLEKFPDTKINYQELFVHLDVLVAERWLPEKLQSLLGSQYETVFGMSLPAEFLADAALKQKFLGLCSEYLYLRRGRLAEHYQADSIERERQSSGNLDAVEKADLSSAKEVFTRVIAAASSAPISDEDATALKKAASTYESVTQRLEKEVADQVQRQRLLYARKALANMTLKLQQKSAVVTAADVDQLAAVQKLFSTIEFGVVSTSELDQLRATQNLAHKYADRGGAEAITAARASDGYRDYGDNPYAEAIEELRAEFENLRIEQARQELLDDAALTVEAVARMRQISANDDEDGVVVEGADSSNVVPVGNSRETNRFGSFLRKGNAFRQRFGISGSEDKKKIRKSLKDRGLRFGADKLEEMATAAVLGPLSALPIPKSVKRGLVVVGLGGMLALAASIIQNIIANGLWSAFGALGGGLLLSGFGPLGILVGGAIGAGIGGWVGPKVANFVKSILQGGSTSSAPSLGQAVRGAGGALGQGAQTTTSSLASFARAGGLSGFGGSSATAGTSLQATQIAASIARGLVSGYGLYITGTAGFITIGALSYVALSAAFLPPGKGPSSVKQSALTVTKIADPRSHVVANQLISYTVTIRNNGDGTITSLVLTDQPDKNLLDPKTFGFDNLPSGVDCGATQTDSLAISCTLPDLKSKEQVVVKYHVKTVNDPTKVTPDGKTVVKNLAKVTGKLPDGSTISANSNGVLNSNGQIIAEISLELTTPLEKAIWGDLNFQPEHPEYFDLGYWQSFTGFAGTTPPCTSVCPQPPYPNGGPDATDLFWCTINVFLSYQMAGYNMPNLFYVGQEYKWFQTNGTVVDNPQISDIQPGDAAFFWTYNFGDLGHVGIVESVSDNELDVSESDVVPSRNTPPSVYHYNVVNGVVQPLTFANGSVIQKLTNIGRAAQ